MSLAAVKALMMHGLQSKRASQFNTSLKPLSISARLIIPFPFTSISLNIYSLFLYSIPVSPNGSFLASSYQTSLLILLLFHWMFIFFLDTASPPNFYLNLAR
jgi:hypothetical protein